MQWQQWQQCVKSRERTEGENCLSVCLGDVGRMVMWKGTLASGTVTDKLDCKYPDTESQMSISGLVIG